MTPEDFKPLVVADGEFAGRFDAACRQVLDSMRARCAVVIVMDGESGSGYSVIGGLEAQVLLPDILQQMAATLRNQLSKNLQ